MPGWVVSCLHYVGNVWLKVFISGDGGVTDSAGVAGSPIRASGFWLL